MKKVTRKTPQSVKTQRKIDAAVAEALEQQTKQDHESTYNALEVLHPYVTGTLEETKPHTGWIVNDWHKCLKWISTWAFAAIGYVSVAGIPPELFALIPAASQGKVTAVLAMLGFLGRFINQSKTKPLPSVGGD